MFGIICNPGDGINLVKSNSKNLWCEQDCRKTVVTSKLEEIALNRSVCVFPVALKVTPKPCGVSKTMSKRYYFQVRGNSFEQKRLCLSSGVKSNSKNLWCEQDHVKTVLLPSQRI